MEKRNVLKSYFWNILIWMTQTLNVFTGGDPDHSTSGRVGFHSARGNIFAKGLELLINGIFYWDYDHCWNSIEWDVMSRYYTQEEIQKIKQGNL